MSPDAPILVGAGDIGDCATDGAAQTAALLDSIPGTVFTVGDNAQGTGDASEFANCYDPSWGRHKARTRPVPGNHDYNVPGASAYFDYFGATAGPYGQGYYSARLPAGWLYVGLNSEIATGSESAQHEWLRQTLKAEPATCIVAAWHQPFVSSGPSRGTPRMRALWKLLQDSGADIVLAGHDHFYERLQPVNADEQVDPTLGIRSFIVGTGGGRLMEARNLSPASAARARMWGVLKIFMFAASYSWEFVGVDGTVFDRGNGSCHKPG